MIPEAPLPAGMSGPPGWLLRVVRDQRVAFLAVGGINTAVGYLAFAGFQMTVGQRWGYLATLPCAHVVSVLIAFVLYRFVVFRVRGHVLADLWRFETVYLSALAVNFVLLPVLVEIAHLNVYLAQALIMFVTAAMSWVGHKNYSFRRKPSSKGFHR
jgi:putative flippase GtrA